MKLIKFLWFKCIGNLYMQAAGKYVNEYATDNTLLFSVL